MLLPRLGPGPGVGAGLLMPSPMAWLVLALSHILNSTAFPPPSMVGNFYTLKSFSVSSFMCQKVIVLRRNVYSKGDSFAMQKVPDSLSNVKKNLEGKKYEHFCLLKLERSLQLLQKGSSNIVFLASEGANAWLSKPQLMNLSPGASS